MKTVKEYLDKYCIDNEIKTTYSLEYTHYINFSGKENHKAKFNELFPDYINYFIAGNIAISEW